MSSPLLQHFDLLATAPGGVARLRELILTLAVQGKLVPQDPRDEPASVLLQKIRVEKDRLIAEGKIKRDKPLPPIAGEDKPFELPTGWVWVRCGDYFIELCTGPFGSVIHQEDYVIGGVPLIIKPLYLAQDDPTRVLTHGGQWVDKVKRLRRRCALPSHVLFPIAPPLEGSKAYPAYQEICGDLIGEGVEVVLANDEEGVIAFACENDRATA